MLIKREDVKENGKHLAKRFIKQICTFSRENGENKVTMVDIENADANRQEEVLENKGKIRGENKEKSPVEACDNKGEKVSVWKGRGTYYEKKEVI